MYIKYKLKLCSDVESVREWIEFTIGLSCISRILLRDLVQLCALEESSKTGNNISSLSWNFTLDNAALTHIPQRPLPCTTINLAESRVGIVVPFLISDNS